MFYNWGHFQFHHREKMTEFMFYFETSRSHLQSLHLKIPLLSFIQQVISIKHQICLWSDIPMYDVIICGLQNQSQLKPKININI